jgi:hypothetical protein
MANPAAMDWAMNWRRERACAASMAGRGALEGSFGSLEIAPSPSLRLAQVDAP